MIKINEFIEKYNTVENRMDFISEHITRHYCPVMEKKVVLQTMFDKCVSNTINGVPFVDALLLDINYVLAVLICYTDIQIVNDDENTEIDVYDKLMEFKCMEDIYSSIGEDEIENFEIVYDYIISTFYDTTSSTAEVILSNIKKYFDVFEVMSKSFGENLPELLNNIE